LADLEELLLAGAQAAGYEQGLWTLGRVRTLIAQRFGVRYSEVAVWKLLRELKWSPQKPEKRAREADREAIERWKSQRWPDLVAEAEKRAAHDRLCRRKRLFATARAQTDLGAPGPHAHPGV
jgi:hypothetical protein